MDENKKVLFFVDRMRVGGIQILLTELFKHFDRAVIEPELLLLDDGEHYDLEDKVRKMGIKVHKLDKVWLRKPWDYSAYRKAMKAFFSKHNDYRAVHMNSGTKNYFVLKYAKEYGIPVRVAHSHNTGFQTKSTVQILLGNIFKIPLRKYANVYLACSDLAGEWMFGKANMDKVKVIPNGIDLDRFAFNEDERNRVRKALDIENKFVVGNVGRFTPQKNHAFLIDIFQKIKEKKPNSVLLLAGIGELMEDTQKKVKALGLESSVRFLGFREDVTSLTQAMDVFLMPSLYEGFPVTAVEAQAAGLPCVFSDTITRNVKILDQVAYIPLDEYAEVWAEKTIAMDNTSNRPQCNALLHEKKYDINDMIMLLLEIYKI